MIENVCNLEDASVENRETELNKDAININNDDHHNAIQVKNTEVETEKTVKQLCMKEDLLALQSNMNKLTIEQNENFKEMKLLRNLIEPRCTSSVQRFNDFEKMIQQNMANLNMQSLLFEERFGKLEKHVDKNQIIKTLFDSLANKLPTLDQKIAEVKNESDEKLELISIKLNNNNNVLADISLLKLNNEVVLQKIQQSEKKIKSTSHSNIQDIHPDSVVGRRAEGPSGFSTPRLRGLLA